MERPWWRFVRGRGALAGVGGAWRRGRDLGAGKSVNGQGDGRLDDWTAAMSQAGRDRLDGAGGGRRKREEGIAPGADWACELRRGLWDFRAQGIN